jgi:hypothetical protein
MSLSLTLSTAERLALRRFAAEFDLATLEDAAAAALRDFLITAGYLELPHELDEESETMGEA